MSSAVLGRRTTPLIYFSGVDITDDIAPHLLSLSYIDNETGETDDLQIRLQDIDGLWMHHRLGQMMANTASTDYGALNSTSTTEAGNNAKYRVIAKSGLNYRAEASTSGRKLGTLPNGTEVEVLDASGSWYKITVNGTEAYASGKYLEKVADATPATTSNGGGEGVDLQGGFVIQALIVAQNVDEKGGDKILDCGLFEFDGCDVSCPPQEVTIKATSLPFSSQIRQTVKTKAWEGYTLSGIAQEMASENGMGCQFLSVKNPTIARCEQFNVSDIAFLQGLCNDYGLSLKATNNMLVLFDQATFEQKPPMYIFEKWETPYLKYKMSTKTKDVKYTSCRVSNVLPDGTLIEGIYYDEGSSAESEAEALKKEAEQAAKGQAVEKSKVQRLEIKANVNSIGEAEQKAAAELRLRNKFNKEVTLNLDGDTDLIAGVTVKLVNCGAWEGKYIISQAKHTIDQGGYKTSVKLRKVNDE